MRISHLGLGPNTEFPIYHLGAWRRHRGSACSAFLFSSWRRRPCCRLLLSLSLCSRPSAWAPRRRSRLLRMAGALHQHVAHSSAHPGSATRSHAPRRLQHLSRHSPSERSPPPPQLRSRRQALLRRPSTCTWVRRSPSSFRRPACPTGLCSCSSLQSLPWSFVEASQWETGWASHLGRRLPSASWAIWSRWCHFFSLFAPPLSRCESGCLTSLEFCRKLHPLFLAPSCAQKVLKPLLDRAEHKLAGLPKGQSRWLALTLFVGVPAPGTGGWTGVIIAYLLNMSFGEAMSSVVCGVMLAGAIMTILTLAGKVGALIALGALIVAGVGAILSTKKE